MNKVEIREAIATAITTWIRWRRDKSARNGFSLHTKREFQSAMDNLCRIMILIDPDHPSKIWREAYKIVELWFTTRRVTTRAMLRLINSYHIGL